MSQHTPEPWIVAGDGAFITSTASADLRRHWSIRTLDSGRHYGGDVAIANARRIAACVNACANIPIEHLEKHGHEFLGFYVQQRDAEQIIQKRDQLQNAINEIKQYIDDYPLDMGLDGFVKSVIAKIGADL